MVPGFPTDQRNGDKEFVIRRAATNRVLNVLRHWVSKHSQVQFISTFSLIFCISAEHSSRKTTLAHLLFGCVFPQDFELNMELKMRVIGFLEEVMHDPELLTQERKAAANIIRLVSVNSDWQKDWEDNSDAVNLSGQHRVEKQQLTHRKWTFSRVEEQIIPGSFYFVL